MRRKHSIATAGFTLVEVMVGLVVTAMVLLAARAMFDAIGATGVVVSDAVVARDARRNGERELRDLASRATSPSGPENRFEGGPQVATFSTWCGAAGGWQERCRVTITARTGTAGATLELRAPDARPIGVLRRTDAIELRYLLHIDTDVLWATSWNSTVSLPLAIAVLTPRDTTLLVIGRRG